MTKAGFRTAALLSAWQLSQVTWFEQVEDEPLFAARCVLEVLIRADAREPKCFRGFVVFGNSDRNSVDRLIIQSAASSNVWWASW